MKKMSMKVEIDKHILEVFITKKRQKNTYIRVKEDLNIYVTTNYFTTKDDILKLIENNKTSISRMITRQEKKQQSEKEFTYLGKKYNLVLINSKEITLGLETILYNNLENLHKWLVKQANSIFLEELNKMYNIFPINIPYPSLTIRKMKTRWGVCNTKTKRVTLNLELIKKDLKYLDYVIVHELAHLVYPNHQQEFWSLVGQVIPNYKELRKELNNYE
ncbi:MAG: M48 family metallopeptidase [Bacilli bacterium]